MKKKKETITKKLFRLLFHRLVFAGVALLVQVVILLVLLLFLNAGAAAYNMPAFYTAFAVLVTAVCLKAGAYWIYSRR